MNRSIVLVLEHPVTAYSGGTATGQALARVIEAHPALATLMDFHTIDPRAVALEIGMVSPLEEDGAEDLEGIDFGPAEWFEPSAGLAAVRQALRAIRDAPRSIAAAIYDPSLRPEDVITDLEAIEQALVLAQQHETRFHLASHGEGREGVPTHS